MIKKLKLGLLAFALLAVMSFGANQVSAAAGDVTWSAAQTIDLSSPDMDLTIASGSTAESLAVGTGTITPTLASGDVFTVATAAAGDFAVSPTTGVIITCSPSTIATVVITATGSQAYTITPSTTACAYSSGGGGGGGGGGSPAPTPTPTPTPTPAPATPATPATPGNVIPGCGNRTTGFSTSTGMSCVGNTSTTPATPATPGNVVPGCGNRTTGFSTSSGASCAGNTAGTGTPATSNGYAFGTTLVKQGTKGEACKAWQMFFNDKFGASLATDGNCGKLTIAQAKAWQKSVGLTADGKLGAMSRAKAMMQ